MTRKGSDMEKQDNKQKLRRAGAILALLFFAAALVGLLVTAFTGGSPRMILVFIFLLGLVPGVIYIFLYFIKVTRERFEEK